jgi:hypothetical protein
MIELTHEQHEALTQKGTEPIRAIDPATSAEYVLLPAEVYDRLKSLLAADGEWAEGPYAAAMEVFARDGWDDPRMDVYDELDPRQHHERRLLSPWTDLVCAHVANRGTCLP